MKELFQINLRNKDFYVLYEVGKDGIVMGIGARKCLSISIEQLKSRQYVSAVFEGGFEHLIPLDLNPELFYRYQEDARENTDDSYHEGTE